jgi:hypothetical protein
MKEGKAEEGDSNTVIEQFLECSRRYFSLSLELLEEKGTSGG